MITEAFLFALQAHGEQKRKDGRPYIMHPVEVAVELARNGAEEPLICAGFLHDVIEDTGAEREQLEELFSPQVAALVAADSEDKSKSWEERKRTMLEAVRSGGREHQMLLCADKLSNLRSIRDSLAGEEGEAVWQKFKRGKQQQAWLFRESAKALAPLEGLPMYEEMNLLIHEIFGEEKE